jgi:NAD(P)H dehydrogenase (quinone)
MMLAAEHKATEKIIENSGIPFVFLRNSWYIENYTDTLAQTLERGMVTGCAGKGRVSAATRADLAAAAAAVLTGGGHENKAYELGGDQAFTMTELAAEISKQSGSGVVYRDLPFDAYVKLVVGSGLPEPSARIIAASDLGIERGDMFTNSGDLRRLISRPTTTLADTIATALQK